MNEIFIIAGIGIISTAFVLILQQYRPEFAFGVAIASGIFILVYTLFSFSKIFEDIEFLIKISAIDSEKYSILLKCFGICFITKVSSDVCKDCGQSSISSKIDFAGKTAVLLTAMPLYSEIIEIVKKIIDI